MDLSLHAFKYLKISLAVTDSTLETQLLFRPWICKSFLELFAICTTQKFICHGGLFLFIFFPITKLYLTTLGNKNCAEVLPSREIFYCR
jgi:hypothetical protein